MGQAPPVPPDRRPTGRVAAGGIADTWSFTFSFFLGEGDITLVTLLSPVHRCTGGRRLLTPVHHCTGGRQLLTPVHRCTGGRRLLFSALAVKFREVWIFILRAWVRGRLACFVTFRIGDS